MRRSRTKHSPATTATATSSASFHVKICEDSDTWVGAQGQRCEQYAAGAPNSWHMSCASDQGATAFNDSSTAAMVTASVACPVACDSCPHCDDGQRNGDETGVDCGGSCPVLCNPNAACVPFEQSGLLGQNMHAICDGDGVSVGTECHTVAQRGYQTASIGSVVAALLASLHALMVRRSEVRATLNVKKASTRKQGRDWPHLLVQMSMVARGLSKAVHGISLISQGSPWYQSGYVRAA
eukprot:SAG31_NODE_57_length_29727_cov_12.584568_5_plen_238_part_00